MKRRKFLKNTALTGAGIAIGNSVMALNESHSEHIPSAREINDSNETLPLVIATWHVEKATAKAMEVLIDGGSALEAVEQGCRVEEANEKGQSVGKGGLPDRDGNVTLDACIMDQNGNCGAVVYLQDITHAVSVARKVMEDTPHVMLAGEGAKQFAISKGFKTEDLLTEASRKAWEKWKIEAKYKPIINIENHDTMGMLAVDKN